MNGNDISSLGPEERSYISDMSKYVLGKWEGKKNQAWWEKYSQWCRQCHILEMREREIKEGSSAKVRTAGWSLWEMKNKVNHGQLQRVVENARALEMTT